ncbi:MAG: hypothetical protein AAF741_16370 [Bacteroidota bacterium]
MLPLEDRLSGGKLNSLGHTLEVVDDVLAGRERLEDLFNCYHSHDELVRLRVSNAMKRIAAANHRLLIPYLPRFISEISTLDQASAQWTLAQLFLVYTNDLSSDQYESAVGIMRRNLESYSDWIVLSQTMSTLTEWSLKNNDLQGWLKPLLEQHASDLRKSVRGRAVRMLNKLNESN